MSDITELASRIRELERKEKQLDHIKENLKPLADQLRGYAEAMTRIAAELDPVFQATRGIRRDWTEELETLYGGLKKGLKVDTDFIRRTYPDLRQTQLSWLIKKLKDMPKVQVTKEGVKNVLFIAGAGP